MPSRSAGAWRWLLAKEWRELMASRAWWVMLALTGPLVGVCFINAVRTYAEVSGASTSGPAELYAPLDGIWAPTFGAYEIIAIFLWPFVAIHLVAGDRQNGALKLELQRRMPLLARMGAKAIALMGGWMIANLAVVLAIVLWKSYGGSSYAPEMWTVAAGHFLNALLIVALAAAAASIAEHPSTAAILTLGITVGTWVIEFAAAIHGGVWERLAAYTPSAMVAVFQHGLVGADVVLVAIALTLAGLALAAVWTQLGVAVRRRVFESVAVGAVAAIAVVGCSLVTGSWDASENRRNSFSEPDQKALAQIHTPLGIEVHLAPEDSRRLELERVALSKLRRAMPHVAITYVARTSTGLFEEADPGYGEIRYDLGGHRAVSRLITGEGVLETIYSLANVTPANEDETEPAGHPLAARPRGAAGMFYGVWPVAVAGIAVFMNRRQV